MIDLSINAYFYSVQRNRNLFTSHKIISIKL